MQESISLREINDIVHFGNDHTFNDREVMIMVEFVRKVMRHEFGSLDIIPENQEQAVTGYDGITCLKAGENVSVALMSREHPDMPAAMISGPWPHPLLYYAHQAWHYLVAGVERLPEDFELLRDGPPMQIDIEALLASELPTMINPDALAVSREIQKQALAMAPSMPTI